MYVVRCLLNNIRPYVNPIQEEAMIILLENLNNVCHRENLVSIILDAAVVFHELLQ